jgi:hypothetical protein
MLPSLPMPMSTLTIRYPGKPIQINFKLNAKNNVCAIVWTMVGHDKESKKKLSSGAQSEANASLPQQGLHQASNTNFVQHDQPNQRTKQV